jgi:hypothetical protein
MNLSMIYLIYCKNFCKYHNVPPQHNNKKNEIEIKTAKHTEF